ncbi:hypothetical protein DIS24_g6454 [Lasiodiplodia hormozganensis]|uniref:Uncharacterized protein n=1 Tax=Lasiodiplodia hormozganensis TaxID=869390 RepID=A0AA39YDU6_9PEZI|nr:hypothetical protein DIS24_g6454 [Lasiodiplodia hormozganensis]
MGFKLYALEQEWVKRLPSDESEGEVKQGKKQIQDACETCLKARRKFELARRFQLEPSSPNSIDILVTSINLLATGFDLEKHYRHVILMEPDQKIAILDQFTNRISREGGTLTNPKATMLITLAGLEEVAYSAMRARNIAFKREVTREQLKACIAEASEQAKQAGSVVAV